jgi:hypothetical protein
MSPIKPVEWVSATIIRQIFNESQLAEKVAAGELTQSLKKNSHLDSPRSREPYCTNSQIVMYFDQKGKLLAIVHQYLRPDGSLGASGKPDPKRLYLPDKIISVRSA